MKKEGYIDVTNLVDAYTDMQITIEDEKHALYNHLDLYKYKASKYFKVNYEDVTIEMRQKIKMSNFASMYGTKLIPIRESIK